MKRKDFFIQFTGWIILLLLIISPAILSAKSIWGIGKTVTIQKDYRDFDKVEISSAFKARILQGQVYNVTLLVDEDLQDYIVVEKRGRTLHIGLKNHRSCCNGSLEAEITMPDIGELGLSGASSAVLEGFNFKHDLVLNLSGASRVEGLIETGNLDLNLSGASNVRMDDFCSNDANLYLSGASNCVVNIDGEMDVRASGSSKVKYCGEGEISTVESSGFSRVSRL